jgi:hypothetical protein
MEPTRRRIAALIVALLTLAALVPAAAAADPTTGFTGTWRTTDCAAWWQDGHLDCTVFGDGSEETLVIGPGETPRATLQDSYASICANSGSPSTRWLAAGTGEYDDVFLWLTFNKSGCGTFGMGGYGGVQLYHDAGSDTIWEGVTEEWGYMWYRAH